MPEKPIALTVYIHEDTAAGVDDFVAACMRPKSQSVDFLLLMGLERFREEGVLSPKEPKPIPARKTAKRKRSSAKRVPAK